jgi:geranylgeranyl pyrophosphate synthase
MTNSGEAHLPKAKSVASLVDLEYSRAGGELFQGVLLDPLATLLHRPAKHVRARLVIAGHAYGAALSGARARPPESVRHFARLLEEMHGASLVIDDIQDGSTLRRGAPTLHQTYGVPVALNAGNWLYFWQLWQLRELKLAPEQELKLTRFCLDTYLKAHFGQALDVGHRADELPQASVAEACLANMELKTGALLAFALGGGALLGDVSVESLGPLLSYGRALGVYLQMADDIGNVSNVELGPKQYEDFKQRRLSWAWAAAASELSPARYAEFLAEVRAYRFDDAHALLEREGVLGKARARAKAFLAGARAGLERDAPPAARPVLEEIESIETLLSGAYEKT